MKLTDMFMLVLSIAAIRYDSVWSYLIWVCASVYLAARIADMVIHNNN